MSDDDYAEMVDDPAWIEATAARGDARAQDGGRADRRARDHGRRACSGRSLERHDETDLAAAAERVAQQRRNHEVSLVTIVSELVSRGIDAPDGLSRTDWLRSHDASLTAGQAKAFVTVGTALADARWARLRLLVTTQQVTVGNAALIVDFHGRTAPVADPDDLATALDDLTDQARQLRPEELARLVRHHTEQIKPPRDEDALDRGRRDARGLWFTQPNATGMVGLRGVLDPEGAAVAQVRHRPAVDPAPREGRARPHRQARRPHPCATSHGRPARHGAARGRLRRRRADHRQGQGRGPHRPRDPPRRPPRRAGTRHPGRSARAGDSTRRRWPGRHSGLERPRSVSASVAAAVVRQARGTGGGTGTTLSGDVLSPGVVRRMACDAEIIPMVLGGDSEPLDVGRSRRLFTRAQRLALAVRDKGCSWAGCTVPASWCDAHHVVHWRHGGHTSVSGGALLCPKHHTEVHERNLTATVTTTGVTWHT